MSQNESKWYGYMWDWNRMKLTNPRLQWAAILRLEGAYNIHIHTAIPCSCQPPYSLSLPSLLCLSDRPLRCRSTHISRPKQQVSTMDNSVQQYKTVDRDEKEQG